MNPVIISAKAEDLPTLEKLAEKIWLAHYQPIISQEQIEYMLNKFNSKEAFEQQIKEGHRFHIIKEDKDVIGYLSESNDAPGDFFLHKFYIDPAYQGKGIGQKVFASLFDSNPTIKTVRLTVNRKNYTSINFYFRLGFIIEKVADFDIGNGYFMNDFVMIRKY